MESTKRWRNSSLNCNRKDKTVWEKNSRLHKDAKLEEKTYKRVEKSNCLEDKCLNTVPEQNVMTFLRALEKTHSE